MRRSGIRSLLTGEPEPDAVERKIAEDAARLYDQGWSVRQVADRFDCGYGMMRRILGKQVKLRTRGGRPRALPADPGAP